MKKIFLFMSLFFISLNFVNAVDIEIESSKPHVPVYRDDGLIRNILVTWNTTYLKNELGITIQTLSSGFDSNTTVYMNNGDVVLNGGFYGAPYYFKVIVYDYSADQLISLESTNHIGSSYGGSGYPFIVDGKYCSFHEMASGTNGNICYNSNTTSINSYTGSLTRSDVDSVGFKSAFQLNNFGLVYVDGNKLISQNCIEDLGGICEQQDIINVGTGSQIKSFYINTTGINDEYTISLYYEDDQQITHFDSYIKKGVEPIEYKPSLYITNFDFNTGEYYYIPKTGFNGLEFIPESIYGGNYGSIPMYQYDYNGNISYIYRHNSKYYINNTVDLFNDYINTSTVYGGSGSGTGGTGTGGTIPPVEEWTFFTSGYTFFENGFSLNNFVPNPYGGQLQFEIIRPSGSGTENIYTQPIGPHETDGNGYGLDSQVKITYPYHTITGEYQVRVLYNYGNEVVYPFGETYNNYIISLPEQESIFDPTDLFTSACEADTSATGFIPGLSKFFSCAVETIKVGIENIFSVYESIREIFTALGNIGNTEEVKMLHEAFINFELIPQTHATETYSYSGSQDPLAIISQGSFENIPLLNNIYNFIKYGALFLILIGMLYLIFKPENNG